MDRRDKKPIIGILGGICSGKSTLAAEFARLGCGVIDADAIVHKLLRTDSVKSRIIKDFGEAIFDSCGTLNRQFLAQHVFNSAQNVEKINNIIHPLVFAETEKQIANFNNRHQIKAIILDMPLLLEVGWEKKCDKLIFVRCNDSIRTQRMAQKQLSTKNILKKREKFQILLDKKSEIADYIVDNNSDLSALVGQAVRIFSEITNL